MQVKGIIPKKPIEKQPNLIDEVGSIATLVLELKQTKEETINTIDSKIKEVDSQLEKSNDKIKEIDQTIEEAKKEILDTTEEILNYVKEIKKGEDGEDGNDGEDADEEAILKKLADQLPKKEDILKDILNNVNEDKIIKKIISRLPKPNASLKVIQEKVETDPMSVIEKIMALPEDKFKLKIKNVDGLEQTISAFRSQLAKGYLHGGGISNITGLITAGTNITISGSGTSTSPYQISSTPGGSDTQVQFNDGGTFGGDSGLVYDKTEKKLSIDGVFRHSSDVTNSSPTEGDLWRSSTALNYYDGTNTIDLLQQNARKDSINITLDGGGNVITTGIKGDYVIPFNGTITGWTILGDVSGSIVVDIWKDSYANYPPTVADTITGSEKPTLSSATKNQDTSLTTWTTSVSEGDILRFNVDSASVVTRVTLSIAITKS